jgi:enoyl-CoA hydratase/carnithine racemase|tara:strand:+ start:1141 stop:1971 length:831 start_codon:yes stop_codon:yes gene_type:complete
MSSNKANINSINQSDLVLEEATVGGILRLTMNDMKRRNALSEEMMAALTSAFYHAELDSSVRVIVLAANGPAYSAGHDLKQITASRTPVDNGKAYFTEVLSNCSALMQLIVNHPKPIIAEVTGVATAAGCQLVASCDLALASESALFSTPGVHIGLFCSTPMVALSRNVSNKAAMEMLLTGEMVSATKAEHIGLVNRVVVDEKLTEATMAMAAIIASKSSMALATGKQAFYHQREMTLADAYDYASQVMVDNLLKHDAEEGINAFIEKRSPEWQDR